ncbi:MAG: MBL fold metallo-hydrolase [Dethiobacteria bacterium]|jgi:L-ascorbate metabolism protein UlaG (beta-lactamase superfamily)
MRRTILVGLLLIFLLAACFAGYHYMAQKRCSDQNAGGEIAANPEQGGDQSERQVEKGGAQRGEITLQYLGHSCFLLDAAGLRILMDPYSPDVGYGRLNLETEIMTISHEHMDHNYAAASPGAEILRGLTLDGLGWDDASYTKKEISIFSMPTYHDGTAGRERGRNAAFVFDLGGLRVVHLGDLGHLLNEGEIEKISPVDVLLIPVGGHYTLNAQEAQAVIAQLSPAVAIPMHYQTEITKNWPLAGLQPFVEAVEKVKEKGAKPIPLNKNMLPAGTEIWVLEPAKS